ncbi:MAG TPA: M48 family metalloprotease [Vicinamibacterales bacterium]|nr:M48 family metalloprotease [Vicinamibacterales bacterium]
MVRTRPSGLVAAAAVALASAAACATNPATGQKEVSLMSEAQEIQLGQQADAEVRKQMGVYEDPALQQYVQAIGKRLAAVSERSTLPWHFTVVDQPAVNAFALPGGFIYITRGILPFLDDEAQLAGVLGHEVGHVTARHAAERYTQQTTTGLGLALLGIFVPETRPFQGLAQQAAGLLSLKYSRDDELQADALGVRYASRAGWNPAGVQQMLTTLTRIDQASGSSKGVPNWLSTHPASADRVEKVQAAVKKATAPAGAGPFVTNRPEYLGHIDGVVYGDEPSQGIVRGNQFLHKDLRIAMTFPDGWDIQNTAQQVVAKAPRADRYLLLELVQQPAGSVAQIAQASMAQAGWQQLSGAPRQINGLAAYVGTYRGSMQGLGPVETLAAHIAHDPNVFVLAGVAPAGQFAAAQQAFTSTIQSFRSLSAAEAEAIRANRVELYTVRAGDTWTSLASRHGGIVKPATLAIMNDHNPGQPPAAGSRVKLVVAG